VNSIQMGLTSENDEHPSFSQNEVVIMHCLTWSVFIRVHNVLKSLHSLDIGSVEVFSAVDKISIMQVVDKSRINFSKDMFELLELWEDKHSFTL
jgi:hypothetical protein